MATWNPRANAIFVEALERPNGTERTAYLDTACGADADLRALVERLLAANERAGVFLQCPAVERIATACPAAGPNQESSPAADDALPFLTPSTRPESLGRLGHYEVLQVVGRGGMGIVLKAFDEALHRVVAIKVLAPHLAGLASARQRFLREARAAAAVCHEHVVTIHAVEPGEEVPYLVMQYVAGSSLQEMLDRQGILGVKEILRIGLQTAEGLAAAHKQGLVHRDVKPANILLENGIERVKLTDFGLARAADDVGLTQSGLIVGTPSYMSPEQADGKSIDHRCDLFSLGVVLYALCTGSSPFKASSMSATLKRVCEHTPRSVREVNSEIPAPLAAVIERLLAKEPAARYDTSEAVAEALRSILSRLQQPDATTSAEPRPAGRRLPRRRLVGAAAVLALLAAFGYSEATGVTEATHTVIRLFTSEGTLVIQTNDPAVSVTIDGPEVVITGAGPKEVRLKAGQYQLTAAKDGKVVRQQLVNVTRNSRQVVNVSLEPSAGAPLAAAPVATAPAPRDRITPEHGWVALLPLVNVKEDHIGDRGEWLREGGEIEAVSMDEGGNAVRLRLPLHLESSHYEFEAQVTRVSGPHAFFLDIPVKDRGIGYGLSSRGFTGLSYIRDLSQLEDENPTRKPFAIRDGQRYRILLSVRTEADQARIEVRVDDELVVKWEGPSADLQCKSGVYQRGVIDLASDPNTRNRFHELRLRVHQGTAKLTRPQPGS